MKKLSILVVILSSLFLTGCFVSEDRPSIHELGGQIFGSYYSVKYVGDIDQTQFQQELSLLFKQINDEFSTYQKDSLISQFNSLSAHKKLKTSSRFIQMLEFSQEMHKKTGGAFDPTLAPVIKAWGFGGGERKGAPSSEVIEAAMSLVGMSLVKWDSSTTEIWKTKDGVQLDANAFIPGWGSDLIGELLEKFGVNNYMADISGEIAIKGEKAPGNPWVIGIEKPALKRDGSVQLVLSLKDLAIATSGNYRQFFDEKGERRSHIIDPRTGSPVENKISSATVIAATAIEADAWSTAMMVLGKEGIDLAEKAGIKVYLLEAKSQKEFKEMISPSMKKFIEASSMSPRL